MLKIRAVKLVVVSTILPFLASLAVGLRVYLRKTNKKAGVGISEYLILVCLFFCWAVAINVIAGAAVDHVGYELVDFTPKQKRGRSMVYFAAQPLWAVSVSLVKLSVLFFYRTIFTTKKFRIICDASSTVVTCWCISLVFASIFQYTPVHRYWDCQIPGTHINSHVLIIYAAASAIALDVWTLCLPLPIIHRLHMKPLKKWLLVAIFWLGSFCVIASILRLYYLVGEFATTKINKANSYGDNAVNGLLWLVIEPCTSVIAACLPTYRALFKNGGGVESMIRSVRSLASLRSWNSRERQNSKDRRSSNSSENPVIPAVTNDTIHGWRQGETTTDISTLAEEHEMERPNRIGVKKESDVTQTV